MKQLQGSLSVLSPELLPVHQRLVTIRRQLVALAAKEGTQKAELKPLLEELRKTESLVSHLRSHVSSTCLTGVIPFPISLVSVNLLSVPRIT